MTESIIASSLDDDGQLTDAMECRLRAMALKVIEQHAARAGLADTPTEQVYQRFGVSVNVSTHDDEICRLALIITDMETGQDTRYELTEDGDLVEFPEAQGTA